MLKEPAPGFDAPIDMLAACHDRILAQCATLDELFRHLHAVGPDQDARQAAMTIIRYFTIAGRQHHDDEEQDLFPLLRHDPQLAESIRRLEADHTELDRLWRELEPDLADLSRSSNRDRLAALAGRFAGLQRDHVQRENTLLLPRARQLLPPELLAVIGARMAARRGVSF